MINLLPYNEKKRITQVRLLRLILVMLWSIIIAMVIVSLLLLPSMTIISTRYNLAQNEITRLENTGVVVRSETFAELQSKTKVLKEQFAKETILTPNDTIAIVKSNVPIGLKFSGFTYEAGEDQKLTLVGTATTREVLKEYVETLQKNEHVVMVDSPISNYLQQRDNDITLIVLFK